LVAVLDGRRGNLGGDLAEQIATKRAQRLAVADCLSGLFRVLPRKEVRDPLGGGVSPKRVAARQRLAEEFGFGSVSMRYFERQRVQAKKFRAQQFSRQHLLVAKMMRCAVAGMKPALGDAKTRGQTTVLI
jgi:hypothetical protein